jgi:hypothetical protein
MRVRVLTWGIRRSGPVPPVAMLLCAAVIVLAGAAYADDFVLVRNARNPITTLSRSQIKDMAVGKKKVWPHGVLVQMVLSPPGSPELEWFATSVIGAPEATFVARVRQEVFKGEMRKPVAAALEKERLDAVAADPGALAVVSAAAARRLPPEIAVVTIK